MVASGGEIERGGWFDELMVGLGPATDLLDLHVARELRQDGTAMALRQWMTSDLNRVAFAVTRGDDPESLILECRHQLRRIADAADARIRSSGSKSLRRRLQQAGIWGASGLIVGFVGTLIYGGHAGGGVRGRSSWIRVVGSRGCSWHGWPGRGNTRPSHVRLDAAS